jgi:hypothetical protein
VTDHRPRLVPDGVSIMASAWQWLRERLGSGGTAPASVELDLVQQIAVLTLSRFGPQPFTRIADEVSATRPATPAEIVSGLLKLETAGVIERFAEPGVSQGDRRYRLTRRGRRFLPYIPREPRSVLEFHI